MSRDDVLYIIRTKTKMNFKYYIFHVKMTDYECFDDCLKLVNEHSRYTFYRGKALIIAHNKQKKLMTEYGVIELF